MSNILPSFKPASFDESTTKEVFHVMDVYYDDIQRQLRDARISLERALIENHAKFKVGDKVVVKRMLWSNYGKEPETSFCVAFISYIKANFPTIFAKDDNFFPSGWSLSEADAAKIEAHDCVHYEFAKCKKDGTMADVSAGIYNYVDIRLFNPETDAGLPITRK